MLSNDDWKIITKLSKLEKSIRPPPLAKFVENEIRSSLGRLGKSYVDTLLIHSSSDLLLPNGMELYECLRNLQSHGLIKKIGGSVYTGNEIDSILKFKINAKFSNNYNSKLIKYLEELGSEGLAKRVSIPVPFSAETSMYIVCPPQSSG